LRELEVNLAPTVTRARPSRENFLKKICDHFATSLSNQCYLIKQMTGILTNTATPVETMRVVRLHLSCDDENTHSTPFGPSLEILELELTFQLPRKLC
jgi:hypothetical protein